MPGPYNKPALSYSDQLQQLKARGLLVSNDSKALHLLEKISYYRLSGYWYPFILLPKSAHIFKANASFGKAFALYCFDREFRKLILGELEKIEIAVRAKMIYNLWHTHGAFWYNDPALFQRPGTFNSTVDKLTTEFNRSDEEFIKAFKINYTDPLPPACMILEISSFGNLSTVFKNLRPSNHKRRIANYFGLDESTFASWLHSFTYVRNVCAHHARLWNKTMGISPRIPVTPLNTFLAITTIPSPIVGDAPILNNNRAYFLTSMIIYLLNTINPNHRFKIKLLRLLKKYPMIDTRAMGFPDGWEKEELWNWRNVITSDRWYNRGLNWLRRQLVK
jgi:abortive infection bacteriophage resistance protein